MFYTLHRLWWWITFSFWSCPTGTWSPSLSNRSTNRIWNCGSRGRPNRHCSMSSCTGRYIEIESQHMGIFWSQAKENRARVGKPLEKHYVNLIRNFGEAAQIYFYFTESPSVLQIVFAEFHRLRSPYILCSPWRKIFIRSKGEMMPFATHPAMPPAVNFRNL